MSSPLKLPKTSYPRIYEIFPRLAGKISEWGGFVDHAKGMDFNWVWMNPFHLTCRVPNDKGQVGSLYSISDHKMLDEAFSTATWDGHKPVTNMERLVLSYLVNGGKTDEAGGEVTGTARWERAKQETERLIDRFSTMNPPLIAAKDVGYFKALAENEKFAKGWYDHIAGQDQDAIREFAGHAHAKGMKVMADLVLNHLSLDHPWVMDEEHKLKAFYDTVEAETVVFAPPSEGDEYFDLKVSNETTVRAHRVEVKVNSNTDKTQPPAWKTLLTYTEAVEPGKDPTHRQLLEVNFPDQPKYVPRFRHYVRREENKARGKESLIFHQEPENGNRWDDVAQFNFDHPDIRAFCMGTKENPGFFRTLARDYLDLGFDGFRCDAAYNVPGEMWSDLIDDSREYAAQTLGRKGEVAFLAEIVGGASEEKSGHLARAGKKWNWATSSLRWWWDQTEHVMKLQSAAGTDWHTGAEHDLINRITKEGAIDFCESHDLPERAAKKYHDNPELAKKALARDYAIAALGSSNGMFMPLGYEYGFEDKLNTFESPQQRSWNEQLKESRVDIRDFIKMINLVKMALPVTPEISKQVIPNGDIDGNIVLIRRQFRGDPNDLAAGSLVIAVNRDLNNPKNIDAAALAKALGRDLGELQVLAPPSPKVRVRGGKHLDTLELGDNARIIYVPPKRQAKDAGVAEEKTEARLAMKEVKEKTKMEWLPLGKSQAAHIA